jgi:hypothetical protein
VRDDPDHDFEEHEADDQYECDRQVATIGVRADAMCVTAVVVIVVVLVAVAVVVAVVMMMRVVVGHDW